MNAQVGTTIGLGKSIFAVRERDSLVISIEKVSDITNIIIQEGDKIKLDIGVFSLNFVDKLPQKFSKTKFPLKSLIHAPDLTYLEHF